MATRRNTTPPPPPPAGLPITPPVEPMLARLADGMPESGDYLFEPKWDGFRALFFRDGPTHYLQSRDLRPLDRYFPEVVESLLAQLPSRCVIDGEIVIATPKGLDFEVLQQRLHPAASRVAKLAKETPASFVAFDALWLGDLDLRERPNAERRLVLERALASVKAPVFLTPATTDRAVATEWFHRFEGAGLDGVMARPPDQSYAPGKRALLKVKHSRTADCVVAGFRWHKAAQTHVGSLLLGLYDASGALHHLGVTSSFTMEKRLALVEELAPLRVNALEGHPWRQWAEPSPDVRTPGAQSRWSAGKDLSFEPLRCERVCEVKYDHLQGSRLRHTGTFLRWRADKTPADCRFDQLEVVPPYELTRIFSSNG